MINVFISVPMRDRTKEDIEYSIKKLKRIARAVLAENDIEANNINFINTILRDTPPTNVDERIWCLGGALQLLSKADYLIAVEESYRYTGCDIEKEVFRSYKGFEHVIEVPLRYILSETEKYAIESGDTVKVCGCKCEEITPDQC